MSRRVVIVTEIIAPYRIPVFNALAQTPGLDLHVIFLSENDPTLRQWKVYRDEIRFPYSLLPSWRRRITNRNLLVNWGLDAELRNASPDTIICGGYSYLASWMALQWAKRRGVGFTCWVESTRRDQRRNYRATEFLKSNFLNRCDSFIVPGKASFEYLCGYGIAPESIFVAPNAVDVAMFSRESDLVREKAVIYRQQMGLPERFFLFVGRLVNEKGVFDALEAYYLLEAGIRDRVALIFAGDGQARARLQSLAAQTSGKVFFTGFVHRDQLPAYYGLADALVFPTHTDTWGLVVNEAMASGLPVVASNVAGCTEELVRDGWNGFVTEPRDTPGLASAMARLAMSAALRAQMGNNSRALISGYTPEACAAGIATAVAMRHVA